MIFIDRNRIQIPEIFSSKEIRIANERLEEFFSRSKDLRRQERFSFPINSKLVTEIRDNLRILFNGKCAYCESIIPIEVTTGEIDDFRPKSGARGFESEFSIDHYWWLMYEWGNKYYSCSKCNRYKSTWFPVKGNRGDILTPYTEIINSEKNLLLDPCYDKPEEHFVYSNTGEIRSLSDKGEISIEILKLNRIELIIARKNVIDLLVKEFEQYDINSKFMVLIKEDIFSLNSRRPYLGIQRQMFSKWFSSPAEYFKDAFDKKNTKEKLHLEENKYANYENIEKNNERRNVDREEKDKTNFENNLDSLKHEYIERLELKNFKCFSNLTLNFNNETVNSNSNTEPWKLFLGENGVGKSSILKAIAIALCGDRYFKQLNLKTSDLLKHNQTDGYIRLYLVGEEKPVEVQFDINKGFSSAISSPKANLVGYGSVRLLPKEGKGKLVPEEYKIGGVKILNLFDYSVSLTDADKWLLDRTQEEFDRTALALKDLMLLEQDDKIERNQIEKRIFIKKEKTNTYIRIEELSDGYQSVYALAVDIMCMFVKDHVNFDLAEGIVLIDEIGTHLHPRWKMKVVSQLKKVFPRIQFIVTTHEPLCLRGLIQGEVSVLARDLENNIYTIDELPDPSTLRVDQILTSPFFGLHSAIDPEIEKIFEEYYALLAKVELTNEEENLKNELSDKIPKMKFLGDTLREELVIYVIDELLAKTKNSFNVDDLKKEAKDRVSKLWESLENE